MEVHSALFQVLTCLLLLDSTYCQKGGRAVDKALKMKGKTSAKTTIVFKTKPTRTPVPDCASISLFRYQHLVAMNYTTTTTEWPEVSRIKKRIADNHPRNSIIIDVLRTKFNLMTEKQTFKVEFGRFKKYILKIGGNGTRFLGQFLEIAKRNLQYEQRVVQIDQFLKKWGIPRYTHINNRFTYITPVNTPPLNYTPTEWYSKQMWFKTSVIDLRRIRVTEKIANPVVWDDLNVHTPPVWIENFENMPGFKHHARKFNLPLKRERRMNKTRMYYMRLAEMRRQNWTGDMRSFVLNGTFTPTTTPCYEQPDVMGAINRYFNDCSIDGPNDPWRRFHSDQQ